MHLHDFAEQVLFSESFEKKLFSPESFTDGVKKTDFRPPLLPTRSEKLRFHDEVSGHARLSFPSDALLKSTEARAKIFHAFANHELLAMELMALALLKFTDAPESFRMGLAHCLKEEQAHLRLYLNRMRQLGIDFGELPVNGFFWNVLKDMKSPLDFVTAMSLTFEQANLDFSYHYKTLFQELGDTASYDIMDQVYREEVGHVKFGVNWLQKWRPQDQSLWDCYCENLPLPLTPQRAKGAFFSAKHREGTGLTKDYIEKLEAFSHSKGRPPKVFVFNANCELEWAASLKKQSTFQAPKFQEDVTVDLASLMSFLGHTEDIVALPIPPSLNMIRKWREWGFPTPNYIPYTPKAPAALSKELQTFKIASFEPWGWSPVVAEELLPYRSCLLNESSHWPPFQEEHWKNIAPCFQKSSVPELLIDCIDKHPHWKSSVCPKENMGIVCRDLENTVQNVDLIMRETGFPVVLKSPLGSSGFNMIRILKMPIEEKQLGWIKKILSSQGALVVEPWLDRIADFSVQLDVSPSLKAGEKPSFLGFTRMISDKRGQYIGHQLGGKLDDLSEEVRRLFYQGEDNSPSFLSILKETSFHVGRWLSTKGFQGPAGIDAFLYRCNTSGKIYLKPIVEVNARYTMGRVALEIERSLATGSSALWMHMSHQRLVKLGFDSWESWLTSLREKNPQDVIKPLDLNGMIRLKSGVFPTNDPETAKSFLSVLIVGKTLKEISC